MRFFGCEEILFYFSGNRAVEAELDRALDSKQKALIELEERKAAMAELEEKEARWREEAMRRQEEVQVMVIHK